MTAMTTRTSRFEKINSGVCPDCDGQLTDNGNCQTCHITPALDPDFQQWLKGTELLPCACGNLDATTIKNGKDKAMLKIDWIPIDPDADYTAAKGTDQKGNHYFTPANRETVICTLPGGFKGYGWTAEEALGLAVAERQKIFDNHNRILEEMKADGPPPIICACGLVFQDCDCVNPDGTKANRFRVPANFTDDDAAHWSNRIQELEPGSVVEFNARPGGGLSPHQIINDAIINQIAETLTVENFPVERLRALQTIVNLFIWSKESEAAIFEFCQQLQNTYGAHEEC